MPPSPGFSWFLSNYVLNYILLHVSLPPLTTLHMWMLPSFCLEPFSPELPNEYVRNEDDRSFQDIDPLRPWEQPGLLMLVCGTVPFLCVLSCDSTFQALPPPTSNSILFPDFFTTSVMMAPELMYPDQSHGENSRIPLESSLFLSHTEIIFKCLLLALLSTTQIPLSLAWILLEPRAWLISLWLCDS